MRKDMTKNLKVSNFYKILQTWNNVILIEFKRNTKIHWVKIHFGTPTFDRITKDEKASNAAKLSAVGGAMGLLTGFSIISGVEIFYFLAKLIVGLFRMKEVFLQLVNYIFARKEEEMNKVVSLA